MAARRRRPALSRIDYKAPGKVLQARIWHVLSSTAGIVIAPEVISQVTEKMPELTGRDVKTSSSWPGWFPKAVSVSTLSRYTFVGRLHGPQLQLRMDARSYQNRTGSTN